MLIYLDESLSDVRVFWDGKEALSLFLKSCIKETKQVLREDTESISTSDIVSTSDESFKDDEKTCVIQVLEKGAGEYNIVKEYDIDFFQDFVGDKEDIEGYIKHLEDDLDNNIISEEISSTFTL